MGDYTNMVGRNGAEQKKEWLKRNNKFVKKLIKKVNDENVVAMVMATELVFHLKEFTDLIVVTEFPSGNEGYGVKSNIKKKDKYGVRIIVDIFQPAGRVNFIYIDKPDNIRFDIPCICGYYDNEPHGDLK